MGVRADPRAGFGGLHHAGHHVDGRDIGAEEDLHPGGVVLHTGVAARCERSDQCDCGCAGDDHGAELLPSGDVTGGLARV